jgi:hypothetical protein
MVLLLHATMLVEGCKTTSLERRFEWFLLRLARFFQPNVRRTCVVRKIQATRPLGNFWRL